MVYMNRIEIEINVKGEWELAASIAQDFSKGDQNHLGTSCPTILEYVHSYIDKYFGKKNRFQIGGHFPINYEIIQLDTWPAFLLDLFPQGNALKWVIDKLGILDRPENYWRIMKEANISPPGNLRVKSTKALTEANFGKHQGFEKSEVLAKGDEFLEYMRDHGAPVSGSTGAAGAAPKYMLVEDIHGRFHAPGALGISSVHKNWLVKFPRGDKTSEDREILRNEKLYYDVASWFGLRTRGAVLEHKNDSLFIPRFDRSKSPGGWKYLGLESLYSLSNNVEFGSRLEHESYVKILKNYCSDPNEDILEYVWRDFVNQMTGNTDNHGRNTSLLKTDDTTSISPLYDFAPMQFDPEVIIRNTNWNYDLTKGTVEGIKNYLVKGEMVDGNQFKKTASKRFEKCLRLEKKMAELGISFKYIKKTKNKRDLLIKELKNYLGNDN